MAARRRVETMEENRVKLIAAARKAFAANGFAASSMDELTADAGLTRGALYHNFGDKKGLLGAVVAEVDGEMAAPPKLAENGRLSGPRHARQQDPRHPTTVTATSRRGRARIPVAGRRTCGQARRPSRPGHRIAGNAAPQTAPLVDNWRTTADPAPRRRGSPEQPPANPAS